ncbi:hypothetical protein Tsubulata_034557 [Turnera subulata]|uniref:DUF4283 domain-containing protein n=1 Tax=Turnera subulata TaxID=218843 RepID=A0A9Q0F110_9ROSI|nr:hypothetical protein Tsubulata_034557 [Turnera subulata]
MIDGKASSSSKSFTYGVFLSLIRGPISAKGKGLTEPMGKGEKENAKVKEADKKASSSSILANSTTTKSANLEEASHVEILEREEKLAGMRRRVEEARRVMGRLESEIHKVEEILSYGEARRGRGGGRSCCCSWWSSRPLSTQSIILGVIVLLLLVIHFALFFVFCSPKYENNRSASLQKLDIFAAKIPVWTKLKHVPLELLTREGLSYLANAIGKPLHVDQDCSRLFKGNCANICIEVNFSQPLKHELVVDFNGETVRIEVSYSWKPQRCDFCKDWGHHELACAKKKPITKWIQKVPYAV